MGRCGGLVAGVRRVYFAGIRDWRNPLKPRLIFILVIAVLALIVLLQNAQEVALRFLFWSVQTSQIFLVVLMLAFGFILGFVTGKLWGRGKR